MLNATIRYEKLPLNHIKSVTRNLYSLYIMVRVRKATI